MTFSYTLAFRFPPEAWRFKEAGHCLRSMSEFQKSSCCIIFKDSLNYQAKGRSGEDK
jgi:hypothetical protein